MMTATVCGEDAQSPASKSSASQTRMSQHSPGMEACPSESKRPATETFAALDSNRDGLISQVEAAMHSELSADFMVADTDSDGALSEAEFKIWAGKQKGDTPAAR